MFELIGIPAEFCDAIRTQAEALRASDPVILRELLSNRWMPQPLWAKRGLMDNPQTACRHILQTAGQTPDRPFCIYLHIPYCIGKCAYCDCYAFALTPRLHDAPQRYVQYLCDEIRMWQHVCDGRPLSTLHFGGGTPLTIGVDGMAQVVSCLRDSFTLSPQTELALESTSSILNVCVLDDLKKMGFNRLHIGVQSLQDPVRQAIGRRESGRTVLEKIRYAVSSGWIVSTDIIIGLPDYGSIDILKDIDAMVGAGVEGFSIFELVHSPRNHAFFERTHLLDQDILEKYAQFQMAFLQLERLGYQHNIYNHMVRGRDHNIYFSSPQRGEDLLPLGTIADGYFGDYLIRHAELDAYRAGVEDGSAGLAGGMQRTPFESRCNRLEIEVRSGKPDPQIFVNLLGSDKALELFRKWFVLGYLKADADFDHCEMQGNGSWFIGAMLSDVKNYLLGEFPSDK